MKTLHRILQNTPSWLLFIVLLFPFVIATNAPVGLSLASFIIILWLWLVGISLKQKAALVKHLSLKWFNISLLYAFCYIVTIEVVFKNNLPKLIIPFHLLAVFCLLSALYFVAKLLVISEEKKSVKANRCFGTFLLFWFFPIGIWFVHPRIKKVIGGTSGTSGTSA